MLRCNLFVKAMLISPWLEKNSLSLGLMIIPFFGALFKKHQALVNLVFLQLRNIHQQKFYRLSKSNFSHFTTNENKNTLLIKLTQALKPIDFQFRFYGSLVRVGDQKTSGKILFEIDRQALKKSD